MKTKNEFIISSGDINEDYEVIGFVEANSLNELKQQAVLTGADSLI